MSPRDTISSGFDEATSLLERIDTERVGHLVHGAVAEIPDLVDAATGAVGSLTDQVAEAIRRDQSNRTRRIVLIAVVAGAVAVTVGLVISRRRRATETAAHLSPVAADGPREMASAAGR